MKITLSKSQWESIGQKAGWMKEAKWGKEDVVDPKKKGMWDGYTLKELESKRNDVKASQEKRKEEGKEPSEEYTTLLRELNFAIRSKKNWGTVD